MREPYYNDLSTRYEVLLGVIDKLKSKGLTNKQINEHDFVKDYKRKIRNILTHPPMNKQIIYYTDETYIDVYDIAWNKRKTKQDLIETFWEDVAKKIYADYSPTGQWFTSDFRCAYVGKDNCDNDLYHCHEYISIDV